MGVRPSSGADRLCPDIVVMAIEMRDLNGIDATRKILAQGSKVRVIALSALSTETFQAAEMLNAGGLRLCDQGLRPR